MKKLLVIFLLSLFAVHGCGQKGALYIPDSSEAEEATSEEESESD